MVVVQLLALIDARARSPLMKDDASPHSPLNPSSLTLPIINLSNPKCTDITELAANTITFPKSFPSQGLLPRSLVPICIDLTYHTSKVPIQYQDSIQNTGQNQEPPNIAWYQ